MRYGQRVMRVSFGATIASTLALEARWIRDEGSGPSLEDNHPRAVTMTDGVYRFAH